MRSSMDKPSPKPRKPSAPELRSDPVKGFSTILAPQRLERPGAIRLRKWPDEDLTTCPFCPGNEHFVPDPVALHPQTGSWQAKIVPNKYPFCAGAQGGVEKGPFATAEGQHEVVVESPRHVRSWTELSVNEVHDVLRIVRDRFRALQSDNRFRCVLFFKNCGPDAGASLTHVHSQIVALAATPPELVRLGQAAQHYHQQNGSCYLCDRIQQPSAHPLVTETQHYRVICPEASRFAYEAWVVPRRHEPRFESTTGEELADLAAVTHAHLTRLEQALPQVCYNLALQSAPFDIDPDDHYHWHLEVIPRIARLAGFELLTRQYVNSVSPTKAAEDLNPAR